MKIYKSAFLTNKKNNTEEIRSHLLDRANCATLKLILTIN